MGNAVLNVAEPGQLVRVRSRQWVVNEVLSITLPDASNTAGNR